MQVMPFKMNCDVLVECENSCAEHAYISLSVFPVLQLCAVIVFISEGISKFISLAVVNIKTKLTKLELPTII